MDYYKDKIELNIVWKNFN